YPTGNSARGCRLKAFQTAFFLCRQHACKKIAPWKRGAKGTQTTTKTLNLKHCLPHTVSDRI
ncbi:TPA: hypothetical protein ACFODG_002044, partial [Neisseria meningitidis]